MTNYLYKTPLEYLPNRCNYLNFYANKLRNSFSTEILKNQGPYRKSPPPKVLIFTGHKLLAGFALDKVAEYLLEHVWPKAPSTPAKDFKHNTSVRN